MNTILDILNTTRYKKEESPRTQRGECYENETDNVDVLECCEVNDYKGILNLGNGLFVALGTKLGLQLGF